MYKYINFKLLKTKLKLMPNSLNRRIILDLYFNLTINYNTNQILFENMIFHEIKIL